MTSPSAAIQDRATGRVEACVPCDKRMALSGWERMGIAFSVCRGATTSGFGSQGSAQSGGLAATTEVSMSSLPSALRYIRRLQHATHGHHAGREPW